MFKTEVQKAMVRLTGLTFPGGGSLTFKEYAQSTEAEVKKLEARRTGAGGPALDAMVGLSQSLLRLVTDLLPLVPRNQRRQFIH